MGTELKNGIPIVKGVVLSKETIDRNKELFQLWLNYFTLYPDMYLDLIQRSDDKYFHLFPYQRVALRAAMRYRYHSWTSTRATSKSFTIYLAGYLRCALVPNTTIMLSSDVKGTVIKIAKQKFDEIFRHWPLLKNELKTRSDDGEQGEKKGSDYYELYFKNGSQLTVVSKDTSRGLRANYGIIEESATVDGTDYAEVLLPQLNVARRCADGYLNPDEPLSPIQYITTAAEKTCWMYKRLIEMVVDSALRPQDYFIWG